MFLNDLTARFGNALIDVIKAIPDRNGTGTWAFCCEINGYQSVRQPGVDLVTFASRHFGTGTLRRVGDGIYAVLRGAPVAPVKAPAFPSWIYFVV